ncbi:MAG: hypothetical protein AAF081_13140, partial [Actinomycetota bacterium]
MRGESFDPTALRRQPGADRAGQSFYGLILLAVIVAFALVGAVIWDVLQGSYDIMSERAWSFLTSPFSFDPEVAGVSQGIRG